MLSQEAVAGRRIAVIGAGPIGLEAALYAATLGADVRVYESGPAAASVAEWGHIRLFTLFAMNHTPLGQRTVEAMGHSLPDDDAELTGAEWRETYLLRLAEAPSLAGRVLTGSRVVTVGRGDLLKDQPMGAAERGSHPFRLLIKGDAGERYEEADVVLDCSGSYTNPNWLGVGGVPALGETDAHGEIVYHPIDVAGAQRAKYIGRRVLLVGSGYSAATTITALAELRAEDSSTDVLWVTRSGGPDPVHRVEDDALPYRAQLAETATRLANESGSGVEWLPRSGISAIERLPDGGFAVEIATAARPRREEVDSVIANVGYEPDDSIYRGLQIHECYASRGPMKLSAALLSATAEAGGDCMKVGSLGSEALANPEPDFFILGMKSYGRNSLFLLGNGYEQVRDVFRLLTGDENLDLYATPDVTAEV